LVSLKEHVDSTSTVADGLGADDGNVIADEVAVLDVAGLAVFDADVQASMPANRNNALTRRSADRPRVVMGHCSARRPATGSIDIVSLCLAPPAVCGKGRRMVTNRVHSLARVARPRRCAVLNQVAARRRVVTAPD
jgi:hypothetical protein